MGPRFHLPAVRYDYQAKDQLRHRFGPDNSYAWIASANIGNSVCASYWGAAALDPIITVNIPQTGVPEPSSLLLLGSGVGALFGAVRRKLKG